MIDSVVLVGGGGHCKSCIDVIETTNVKIAGILDNEAKGELLGYKVIGTDEELQNLAKQHFFLVTLGQIKSASFRKKLFHKIKTADGKAVTIISSKAIVSKYSSVGEGSIVMHQAIVNANSSIGTNCIINSNALVEHDSYIGNHTHISTGAIINGGCRVGEEVFVGSNVVVTHGIEIGNNIIIGAGSVVIKSILQPGTYVGNPVRRISNE